MVERNERNSANSVSPEVFPSVVFEGVMKGRTYLDP
jgi:hypothetical protein